MAAVATKKDKRFWDRLAEKYARTPIADEDAYRLKLDMTREYFTPESRVFEFGCGTGSTALLHAPFVADIDAIDLSTEMIAIADRKAREAGVTNVHFAQGDIATVPMKEGAYDVVLGLSILHLVRNRRDVLRRVHAFLKPGGTFVSSTACLSEMGFWRFVLPLMQAIGKAPAVSVFSPDELVAELSDAGFEVVHQWQPKKNAAQFLVARKR